MGVCHFFFLYGPCRVVLITLGYTTFDMYELTYCPDFDEDAIKETRVYTLDGITFIDDRYIGPWPWIHFLLM